MPGRGQKDGHIPPAIDRRKSSNFHYHTFGIPPPKSRGYPPSREYSSGQTSLSQSNGDDQDVPSHQRSALPVRQLLMLAFIALAEQTALNSISPYLPEMVSSFSSVGDNQTGTYVGVISSSFAVAQFATNFLWASLSNRIGRKPVIMLSTSLTAIAFVAFGFCRTLGQAIAVQVMNDPYMFASVLI